MKGRKRHIVVDTQGLLLAVTVHPADIQDRDGAKLVLQRLLGRFPRLEHIWADGAYAGKLVGWAQHIGGWNLVVWCAGRPTSIPFRFYPAGGW